jgi:arsenate reductase
LSEKILIYQKPTCSKCRATLSLLEESGQEFEAIDYYRERLTMDALRGLLEKLEMSARDILRKDEPSARALEGASDDEILAAMVEHPDLIQRPIAIRGNKAKLCRPPENVRALLGER